MIYLIGGIFGINISLCLHEISHDHAFRDDYKNRLLGLFMDTISVYQYQKTFRRYIYFIIQE